MHKNYSQILKNYSRMPYFKLFYMNFDNDSAVLFKTQHFHLCACTMQQTLPPSELSFQVFSITPGLVLAPFSRQVYQGCICEQKMLEAVEWLAWKTLQGVRVGTDPPGSQKKFKKFFKNSTAFLIEFGRKLCEYYILYCYRGSRKNLTISHQFPTSKINIPSNGGGPLWSPSKKP